MTEPSVQSELSRMKRTSAKPKLPYALRRIPAQGDVILLFIALCYVLLGLLNLWKIVAIEPAAMASFSLAGMFFVLSDFVRMGIHWMGRIYGAVCIALYFLLLLGSALCLTVVPLSYQSIGWIQSVVIPLGDVSTFAGFGILIAIIVVNNVWQRGKIAEAEKQQAASGDDAR